MVHYIVSGIERSGTSMMMQLLHAGGAPMAFDTSRSADVHNPKGYFELEGGKIINRLMDGTFPLDRYEGTFIKITAYGLKFLPVRSYKIIYMMRDLDEVLDSMEKMSGPLDRAEEKPLFARLNTYAIDLMERREDIEYLAVNYRDALAHPAEETARLNEFLGGILDEEAAVTAVDPKLYRNVRRKGEKK
jgi:hypothetical protein